MELMKPLMPWTRRRAVSPLTTLREEMDRLFDWTLESDPFLRPMLRQGGELAGFVPRIDVTEDDKQVMITAELPGMEEKDVAIELAKDRLILKGEKKMEREEKEEGWYRKERLFGSFYRELPLPWEVDAEKVTVDATFEHGVLTVTVPRPKEVQQGRRRIAIHA